MNAPHHGRNADQQSDSMIRAVGTRIRQQRKARNLSLEQLAQIADVSTGLISGLERGRGNPSFNALVQVSHALEIPVASLLTAEQETDPVVRAAERRSLDFHGSGEGDAEHHLLTTSQAKSLEAVIVTAPPGYDTSDTPFQHPGEEFGLVLSGQHEIYLDGHKHVLGPGDSITYPSIIPHWYRNPGPEIVTAIWVVSPPTF